MGRVHPWGRVPVVGHMVAGSWEAPYAHSHQGALGVDLSRFQNTRAPFSLFRAVLLHLAVRALLDIDRQRDKDAGQPSRGCIPCPAGALPFLLAFHKLPPVLEPYPFP